MLLKAWQKIDFHYFLNRKIPYNKLQFFWQKDLLEKKILKWIRKDLKLPVHLSKEFMVSGHTETVDLNEINLPMLFRKVEEFKKGL